MHACQCEKPKLARLGRFARFNEDAALTPPSEETVDSESFSMDIPSPPMEAFGGDGLKQVVKTAVVFWAVTRILDRIFLAK